MGRGFGGTRPGAGGTGCDRAGTATILGGPARGRLEDTTFLTAGRARPRRCFAMKPSCDHERSRVEKGMLCWSAAKVAKQGEAVNSHGPPLEGPFMSIHLSGFACSKSL